MKTFFFALHLILVEKSDGFWAEQFDSDLCSSHISEVFGPPPPPPFQNPAYATVQISIAMIII